ncbi:hypothetical protein [Longimicrobium sp.]|uniref:hypothetical protein n=1 Tax=Longimicrobium sp. TaxID=2029185 RepID=UPI002E31ACB5|nr:hypothetical protein [Longimicrobium sp.]HEX6038178.1 hypothetical protein [Longimicrobium sp.]
MSSEYNRRHTDRGYIVQFPTTINAIRWALGLVPVTESLSSLSHWRRRSATQETAAGN